MIRLHNSFNAKSLIDSPFNILYLSFILLIYKLLLLYSFLIANLCNTLLHKKSFEVKDLKTWKSFLKCINNKINNNLNLIRQVDSLITSRF